MRTSFSTIPIQNEVDRRTEAEATESFSAEGFPGTVPPCGDVSCYSSVAQGHGEGSEKALGATIFLWKLWHVVSTGTKPGYVK